MSRYSSISQKLQQKKYKLPSFIFLILFPSLLFSQAFQRFDYLPVSHNGTQLRYPWTGGLNSVQFGKVDVNRDGKKDLVAYDKSNKKYCVFLLITGVKYLKPCRKILMLIIWGNKKTIIKL